MDQGASLEISAEDTLPSKINSAKTLPVPGPCVMPQHECLPSGPSVIGFIGLTRIRYRLLPPLELSRRMAYPDRPWAGSKPARLSSLRSLARIPARGFWLDGVVVRLLLVMVSLDPPKVEEVLRRLLHSWSLAEACQER